MQPSFSTSNALFGSIGICRCLASPLPDPQGIIPSAVSVCTNERAISLIVPSPPIATTISVFSSAALAAISTAWPALSVFTTSQEYLALSIFSSSKLRINSLLCVPEIGLTTNFIFFILSFMLFLSIVDDKSNINILNFNLLEVSNHTRTTFFS